MVATVTLCKAALCAVSSWGGSPSASVRTGKPYRNFHGHERKCCAVMAVKIPLDTASTWFQRGPPSDATSRCVGSSSAHSATALRRPLLSRQHNRIRDLARRPSNIHVPVTDTLGSRRVRKIGGRRPTSFRHVIRVGLAKVRPIPARAAPPPSHPDELCWSSAEVTNATFSPITDTHRGISTVAARDPFQYHDLISCAVVAISS
jgi:hypothetical protein